MRSLSIVTLLIGGWMVLQGILHDVFVLRSEHGKQYDRNLLRLLMDGHILITCGAMQMIASFALPEFKWSYFIAAAASLSFIIYCTMIYPFLKSFFTLLLNIGLLVFVMAAYFSL